MAPAVEKGRKARLDEEVGTIRKPWRGRVRVALVYPNHYGVGMASLGFQTVYRLLNELEHVVCERAFVPEPDAPATAPLSLESGRPLADFDCVAFSISFENDYVHVLNLLHQAGLPLTTDRRGASHPLIVAGGVSCFLNPEPIASFIDCFLIGEAEALVAPFFSRFDPARDRRTFLLEAAREMAGVYVPAFYGDHYHADGTLAALTPVEAVPERVRRVPAPDIRRFDTQSVVLTGSASFNDAHLIEVSRGCAHGCRFCAAGFVYRPPRYRLPAPLLAAMRRGADRTAKIGLMGAAVSDLPDLAALCAFGARNDLQMAFSSLRADALDDTLIAAFKTGRMKTATIAPEAGSERLRRVLNKGLDEETILQAAEKLVAGGIPNLKLYFMVGLPTETDADAAEVVALVKRIKHRFLKSSRARGHMGAITVSLNCFVPKPFTPFQWVAMEAPAVLKRRIKAIQKGLGPVANVRVHADVPRWANIQALLARGDRRVSRLLLDVRGNGGHWSQAFKRSPVNPAFYVERLRHREELFPWEILDHGLNRAYLRREYQRAMEARSTPPCPADPEHCHMCGVCGVAEQVGGASATQDAPRD